MSSTNGVTQTTAPTTIGYQAPAKREELGKDAFLKLLITQMQYQDPLNPMDNQQFMAQMAQFSSLEQMQNLNLLNEQGLAAGLLGRYVAGKDAESGEVFVGIVDGFRIVDGQVKLNIGGKDHGLSEITDVSR